MHDMINLSTPFLQAYQHQFAPFCKQFENESWVIKDKRKHHGAMDKRSLEQQFCKSDMIIFAV